MRCGGGYLGGVLVWATKEAGTSTGISGVLSNSTMMLAKCALSRKPIGWPPWALDEPLFMSRDEEPPERREEEPEEGEDLPRESIFILDGPGEGREGSVRVAGGSARALGIASTSWLWLTATEAPWKARKRQFVFGELPV